MSPRELLKTYWQIPAAALVASVAVGLSHQTEPLPQILPEPKPDLVTAVVVRGQIAAGEPISRDQLTETQYPLAWMPLDALTPVDTRLDEAPLASRDLTAGTPLAANMLMPNPMTGFGEAFDAAKLFMPVPAELARMLPRELPPKARASLVYESKVGDAAGVVLSQVPVTRSGQGEVNEVTWLLLETGQLATLQRALRLGRLQLALCREVHCPQVTLKRIPEAIVAEEKKDDARASVTVGLS